MGESAEEKAELHATWEGYLLSKVGEAEWRVLKVEDVGAEVRVVARHAVKRGKCDCKGFKHRLDCRHVKMIQHRQEPSDRSDARRAVSRLMEGLDGLFDRLVLEGYETDGEDESRVRRAIIRAQGDPLEVDGVKHWNLLGLMKPGVLIEVRISG